MKSSQNCKLENRRHILIDNIDFIMHDTGLTSVLYQYRLQSKTEFQFLDPHTLVNLNIGGQFFEITVDILTRDPFSILAACCRVKPLFQKSEDNKTIYFDRDWWIFRHILSYLRSNILPNEIETLKELYKEASFYRLESLQRSIEEIPVNEISNFNAEIPQFSTRNSGGTNYGSNNQSSHRIK
jgi:hypothetical protein